jgi:hypothetical protein
MPNKAMKDYPLKHLFRGHFTLGGENEANNSTILPYVFSDQGKGDPMDVNTNPLHEDMTPIDQGASCYMGSVVNNIRVQYRLTIPVAGQENKIHAILYQTALYCHAFDDLDTIEETSGNTVGSFMKLKKEATNEDTVHPDWSGTILNESTAMPSTDPFLPSATMRAVDLNMDTLKGKLVKGSASGMLKKLIPFGIKTGALKAEHPFFFDDWMKNHSRTKRMNKGTFLGQLWHVPQDGRNYYLASETTNQNHFRVGYEIEFNEYNDNFNMLPGG